MLIEVGLFLLPNIIYNIKTSYDITIFTKINNVIKYVVKKVIKWIML